MKELNELKQDKVKIEAQRQIEKQTILVGTSKLRAGHRCFEVNTKTLEVKEAEYVLNGVFEGGFKREVVINPYCVYINALNKNNALKVFKKGGRKEVKPFMKLGFEHLD